jgi:hypothetical protein
MSLTSLLNVNEKPLLICDRRKSVSSDNPKAKAAYPDFLALWKDADTDIPILKQAKAENAKLQ